MNKHFLFSSIWQHFFFHLVTHFSIQLIPIFFITFFSESEFYQLYYFFFFEYVDTFFSVFFFFLVLFSVPLISLTDIIFPVIIGFISQIFNFLSNSILP